MKISKIWSSILGIESIGINDDFFRIGGDSISAIQLISRIRNELDISISIFEIFNYRTIQIICDNIHTLTHSSNIYNSFQDTISENILIKNKDYLTKIQQNKEIDGIYLANSLQEGFLYHSLK